jgi:hypothetical protein
MLDRATGPAYARARGVMDETTTLVVVGALVVLVCAARLLLAMLGGGRGTAETPPSSFRRLHRVGRRAGASGAGAQTRRSTPAGIGRVGRLADDEVRRVLDDLKAKTPPRRG